MLVKRVPVVGHCDGGVAVVGGMVAGGGLWKWRSQMLLDAL